jgi:hypothetical protein
MPTALQNTRSLTNNKGRHRGNTFLPYTRVYSLFICRSWESLVLLFIMSSNLNCAGPSEEDVVVIQTEEGRSIKFNNMLFSSWQAVLDKLLHLKLKAKPGSVWTRLFDVPDPSTHADAFKLECKECGASCQLANTSKWHTKDHSIQTCRTARARSTAVEARMSLPVLAK